MSSNKVIVTANEESKSLYTISLDDIDVNLLTFDNVINRCEASNIKPLWSNNNLKKRSNNVYYQFEIVAEAINDGICRSSHEFEDIDIDNTYKKQKRADVAVQTEQTQINSNEVMELNTYIKIFNAINESSQILTTTVQNDGLIEIKTPEGGLIMPIDNFHGFFRAGDSIQCRACRIMVDDEYAHILSMKHLTLILKPINATQGVRQVDDIFSHCILCNELIENVELHALCSERHNPLLKNAFTPAKSVNNKTLTPVSKSKPNCEPKSSVAKSEISTFSCDECFKEIPIIDIELHMNSEEHLNKQANRNKKKLKKYAHKNKAQKSSYNKTASDYNFMQNSNTAAAYVHQKTDDEKLTSLEIENLKLKKETEELNQIHNEIYRQLTYLSPYHDLIISGQPQSLCYVCNVKCNNTNYHINMHLSEHSHMCQYVEFLHCNYIKPTMLDYNCLLCRQNVSRYSIVNHTESYQHKLMRSKKWEALRSNEDSSVFWYITGLVLLPTIAGLIYFKRRFL